MRLIELVMGQKAMIRNLSGCHSIIQRRLNHLGVHENSEVCIENKMPFGGPCMISCGEQCISIRAEEAHAIEVEVVPCK